MNNIATYKIFPELNIIIEYYHGIISLESLIKYKEVLFKDKLYSEDYNYLDDFRDAEFNFSFDEITDYITFEIENIKVNRSKYLALIFLTPKQSVPLFLYLKGKQTRNNNIEVFSTVKSAISWVRISDDHYTFINDTLIDLKKQLNKNSK